MVVDKQLSVFVKTRRTVGAYQVVPVAKNPPASAGDMSKCFNLWVGKILEKEMATHSSILAWRIPWTEGPEGYSAWSLRRVRHNRVHTHTHTHTHIHTRTENHGVNLTAYQMIKTITQEVGRTQEGT